MWRTLSAILRGIAPWGIYLAVLYAAGVKLIGLNLKDDQGRFVLSLEALFHVVFVVAILFLAFADRYFKDQEKSKKRRTLDRFCEFIHEKLGLSNECRVSIFQMNGGRLAVVGRFAQFDTEKGSKVKFTSSKGCVGFAYYSGGRIHEPEFPDFAKEPQQYYDAQKKLGLTKKDVDKLGRKARSVLAIPIMYNSSRATAAVFVLDSMQPHAFSDNTISEATQIAESMELRASFGEADE
jgi:hypothetical protein